MGGCAPTLLTELVPCGTLHRLQDGFAAIGQVTVCIATIDGELITQPTWGSRFSELIGTSELGQKIFQESVIACAQSPSSQNRIQCLDGMTLYAARIIHGEDHLGTIVAGTRPPFAPQDDELRELSGRYGVDAKKLKEGCRIMDPYRGGSPEAIHRFADVLADTIAALYMQAENIQRQLQNLHAVHELTELLSKSRNLQKILDTTVKRVVDLMPVKACGIRLLNEETGELVIKAVHNLSEEYLNKGPVLIDENAIDAAAFEGETVHIEDAAHDPRIRYPQNALREGIVSGLCVPMTYLRQTVGVLRVYSARRYHFNEEEVSLVRSIASQAASAVITSTLFHEQAAAERVRAQLETAGEIQRRMLPDRVPQHPRLSFGCVFDPSLDLGGDFYDFIELADGRIGLGIADVVGKGLPAALMMASVRSALRGHAHHAQTVASAVGRVNRHMCRDTLTGEFATLTYGEFSQSGDRFTYCNAGHVPPILLRDNKCIDLVAGGLVIGVDSTAEYEQEQVELQANDVLVLVTDGVIEAMSFEDQLYGNTRLVESILRHQALDAQHLAMQIQWDVRRFVGLASQSDDITIVVVKVQ